jgi:hypothetical protein
LTLKVTVKVNQDVRNFYDSVHFDTQLPAEVAGILVAAALPSMGGINPE